MYRLAAFFKEPNVEGEGGLIHRMSYDQFWTWLEFNRLNPFMEERGDFQAAQVASAIYNVNIIDQDKLTKPKDFMLKSMEEVIEEENVERQQLEKLESESDAIEDNKQANLQAWNQYIHRLTQGRKPVETTFKG